MLRPAYKLTIGDRVIDTGDEPKASIFTGLTVVCDMDVRADQAELAAAEVGSFRPQVGDEVTLALGYSADDELGLVMTGLLETMDGGYATSRLLVVNSAAALLRARHQQTYEGKDAGTLVRALAELAGVTVAEAHTGIQFPAYVIDGDRSLYRHMHDLADLCGFDVYLDHRDQLHFKPFTGGQRVHNLDYGTHLLDIRVWQTTAIAQGHTVYGEGPSGHASVESWPWLTKDFSNARGQAGDQAAATLLERPSLRSGDAAQTAADAAGRLRQRRLVRGWAVVQGLSLIRLGDAIRLRQLPRSDWNQTYQVRAIHHQLDKYRGFLTTIRFWGLS